MKTIAVDIDNVMADQAQSWIDFTNKRFGTKLGIKDFHDHWAKIWRVEEHQADKYAKEYLMSNIPGLLVIDNSQTVLKHLAKSYNLVILTSRKNYIKEHTTQWLEKHFKGIFSGIHYSGIWDKTGEGRINQTKGQILEEISADYLIDDELKHCFAAAGVGLKAVLFGDYAWNRADKLPPNVFRAKNWHEVREFFNAES